MREFSRLNLIRCETGFGHALDSWSLAEWTNAMCGEAGEAANVAKKLLQHRDGVSGHSGKDTDVDALKRQLVSEIADTIIYADLCIQAAGGQMADAVRDTFNRKSEQIGSPVRWQLDESQTVEEKRLDRMGMHNMRVSRDRIRRDLSASMDREAKLKEWKRLAELERAEGLTQLGKAEARVAELEAEKLALDTCWRCKSTLEKVGSHESRVPRCPECPEPESMDDVEQSGKGES